MTVIKGLPIVLAILAMGASSLMGQAREIQKADFAGIEDVGYAKLRSISYRVKHTYESDRDAGNSEYLISSVTENKPPDRRRTLSIWKTANGTKRDETIEIGERKFSRKNDGPWSEDKKKDGDRYTIYGDPADAKETLTYLYVGPEVISGVSAKLYERRAVREYRLTNGVFISDYTERFWIDSDGRFVKRESTSTTTQNGKSRTSRSVSEYEYDARITIDVPIR